MRERAAGDVVQAEPQVAAHVLGRYVAGALRLRTTCDEPDGLTHLVRFHVVEHDDVRACLHGLADLVVRLALDLDLAHEGRMGLGRQDGLTHTAGSTDVVILEQDPVG